MCWHLGVQWRPSVRTVHWFYESRPLKDYKHLSSNSVSSASDTCSEHTPSEKRFYIPQNKEPRGHGVPFVLFQSFTDTCLCSWRPTQLKRGTFPAALVFRGFLNNISTKQGTLSNRMSLPRSSRGNSLCLLVISTPPPLRKAERGAPACLILAFGDSWLARSFHHNSPVSPSVITSSPSLCLLCSHMPFL